MRSHVSPRPSVNRYREYIAGCVDATVPRQKDDPIPWKDAIDRAAEYAASNGIKQEPKFRGSVRKFKKAALPDGQRPAWWLRPVLEEEFGCFLEGCTGNFGREPHGIRRAGRAGIARDAKRRTALALGGANSVNRTVGNAKPVIVLPFISMKMLEAGSPAATEEPK